MARSRSSRREQGSGSVYKRKADGRWVSVVDLGWLEGKRQRKYFVSRTEEEAVKKLNKALGEHGRGLLLPADRTTVAKFLTSWIGQHKDANNIRARTYDDYLQVIENHLIPAIGRRRLDQLTPQHVQSMITATSKEGLSARTVNKIRAVLRSALSDAEKWGMVHRNVAKLVRTPKVSTYEGNVLTAEEGRRLLISLRDHPLEALVSTAFQLGLRQGEVLGLRWQDVNLERAECVIRQQYQAGKNVEVPPDATRETRYLLKFSEPKTDRSRRPLPLPPQLVRALKGHRARQEEARHAAGWRWVELDLVFTTEIGTPINQSNLGKAMKLVYRMAGIKPRSFHDLRRSASSILQSRQVSTATVRDLLGHSDASTTMKHYTRSYDADMRSAVNILGDLADDPPEAEK